MDELKGVGHFSFWFVVGYLIFIIALRLKRTSQTLNLYAPFLPFILGLLGVFPYILVRFGSVPEHAIANGYNFFLGYGVLNKYSLVVTVFSNFYLAIFLDGIVYLLLLLYYIKMMKVMRHRYAK